MASGAGGIKRPALAVAAALAVSAAAYALAQRSPASSGADATPLGQQLAARLAAAKGGETITLAPGDYGVVKLQRREFSPSVRIVAKGARFAGIALTNVGGLSFEGGAVVGPGDHDLGINVRDSHHLTFRGMTISGVKRGMGLGGSHDLVVENMILTKLQVDGINVPMSHRVVFRGIQCTDFAPNHSVYDEAGELTKVGDHPDCIQSWSRPKAPPTSDILIENSEMRGDMQGIFFGNHVRDGVDDGGFDRIVIRNNRINVTRYNGIALIDARDSVVVGNTVKTLPGGVNPRRPDAKIRSGIRVRGNRNRACGNSVPDFPGSPETKPCRE